MKRILGKVEMSKYYIKCYYCDTEFEYDKSDVETLWNKQARSHQRMVTCPCCNRQLLHRDSLRSNISTESL